MPSPGRGPFGDVRASPAVSCAPVQGTKRVHLARSTRDLLYEGTSHSQNRAQIDRAKATMHASDLLGVVA
jgi:hypothetical protein